MQLDMMCSKSFAVLFLTLSTVSSQLFPPLGEPLYPFSNIGSPQSVFASPISTPQAQLFNQNDGLLGAPLPYLFQQHYDSSDALDSGFSNYGSQNQNDGLPGTPLPYLFQQHYGSSDAIDSGFSNYRAQNQGWQPDQSAVAFGFQQSTANVPQEGIIESPLGATGTLLQSTGGVSGWQLNIAPSTYTSGFQQNTPNIAPEGINVPPIGAAETLLGSIGGVSGSQLNAAQLTYAPDFQQSTANTAQQGIFEFPSGIPGILLDSTSDASKFQLNGAPFNSPGVILPSFPEIVPEPEKYTAGYNFADFLPVAEPPPASSPIAYPDTPVDPDLFPVIVPDVSITNSPANEFLGAALDDGMSLFNGDFHDYFFDVRSEMVIDTSDGSSFNQFSDTTNLGNVPVSDSGLKNDDIGAGYDDYLFNGDGNQVYGSIINQPQPSNAPLNNPLQFNGNGFAGGMLPLPISSLFAVQKCRRCCKKKSTKKVANRRCGSFGYHKFSPPGSRSRCSAKVIWDIVIIE